MSRFGMRRDRLGRSPIPPWGPAIAVLVTIALAACTTTGSPSQLTPTSSPTSEALTPPPSSSTSGPPSSGDPTGLRWVPGAMAGIAASTDPDPGLEFHLLGWSKGYVGFTSTFDKATGSEQSIVVTASADGLTWKIAGRLDLGSDRQAITVTGLVEGPAGLIATAEPVGCSLHKPAVRMWRSTDGASWTAVDLKGTFGADDLPSVSAGSAGYVVLGSTAKERMLWTSRDGVAWHKTSIPSPSFGPQSVASSSVGFVVAGRTPAGPLDCGVTVGGPVIHYAGSAWSSTHGSSWTEVRLPDALAGPDTTMWVDRLSDSTVMISEVGDNMSIRRAWTSTDGLTWRRNDALAFPLGHPLTEGTRTIFIHETDQGAPELWMLGHDLGVVKLAAGDLPITPEDTLTALGPAGLLVSDSAGATSWLGELVR